MKIALAGNPNSGKTTVYNALTGQNETVGNWAGVTVDRHEHSVKSSITGGQSLIAVDLPGAYSMSPFTSEESITRDYIKNEKPDVIVNIVDATNLARSLFFTTQLLELGIPIVVALNKSDINEKRETVIDTEMLSKSLCCPVVSTASGSSKGLRELIGEVLSVSGKRQSAPYSEKGIDIADKKAVEEADKRRYEFVNGIVSMVERRKVFTAEKNFQDKIDAVITNRWVGIPIFAVVIFVVFWISQVGIGAFIADWLTELFDRLGEWASALLAGANPLLISLIVDGIIGGVGAVLGFLPLVMVMYFLIALLEDCGYMARAAVVLDPIFKRVGLSGRSVIPFVIGTGCAVPAVMSCRTIRDERERRATVMLAPLMPCGAKLPVISLFAGAFFNGYAWVGAAMYLLGIVIVFVGALLINLLTGYRAKCSYFVMELPEYKAPSVPKALASMCRRGWSYIVKAGTIILICNFAVNLMQSYTWTFKLAENAGDSILAGIATPFAYLFAPITGAVIWQLAAAVITGFIAKENVVGTLAVCFVGLENLINSEDFAIMEGAGAEIAGVMAISKSVALAYLILNLFSPPCFAAMGAMRAEMKSRRWLFAGIGFQLALGYTVGFLVNFFGSLVTGELNGEIWIYILGWCIVTAIAASFAVIIIRNRKRVSLEHERKAAEHVSKKLVSQ